MRSKGVKVKKKTVPEQTHWDATPERWLSCDEMTTFGVYSYCEKSRLLELVWLLCLTSHLQV